MVFVFISYSIEPNLSSSSRSFLYFIHFLLLVKLFLKDSFFFLQSYIVTQASILGTRWFNYSCYFSFLKKADNHIFYEINQRDMYLRYVPSSVADAAPWFSLLCLSEVGVALFYCFAIPRKCPFLPCGTTTQFFACFSINILILNSITLMLSMNWLLSQGNFSSCPITSGITVQLISPA